MRLTGKPLLLMVLDGWGMPLGGDGDALSLAELTNFTRLWKEYPHTSLGASGLDVGLPKGQMGNSEVGHMNMGCGRVIYQDLTRINQTIDNGEFFNNAVLLEAMEKVRQSGALHLFGLLSDGGVHSHIEHLFALLKLAKEHGLKRIYIHCFTDGRDTSPKSALGYIRDLEEELRRLGVGKIATVMGRFFAMDRDNRWQRVEKAYRAFVYGEGNHYTSAAAAVSDSYARGTNDEFIEPVVITDTDGEPAGLIKDGDSVIFFNYRSDRAREITRVFTEAGFNNFHPGEDRPTVHYVCFTKYSEDIDAPVAFPEEKIANCLGEVVSKHGMKQLRIAETEKYPHVTFFFNGGEEEPFQGEDRVLVPSPKVVTYDMQPEMSAVTVTDEVVKRIDSGQYDVIVLNYANPDMVGHTGKIPATVKALNTVDQCLGRVHDAVTKAGGTLIVTADHGNVEKMRDSQGKPFTAHTTDRVPFILVDDALPWVSLKAGVLSDIAPTMLELLGIERPAEMRGKTLIAGDIQENK